MLSLEARVDDGWPWRTGSAGLVDKLGPEPRCTSAGTLAPVLLRHYQKTNQRPKRKYQPITQRKKDKKRC